MAAFTWNRLGKRDYYLPQVTPILFYRRQVVAHAGDGLDKLGALGVELQLPTQSADEDTQVRPGGLLSNTLVRRTSP